MVRPVRGVPTFGEVPASGRRGRLSRPLGKESPIKLGDKGRTTIGLSLIATLAMTVMMMLYAGGSPARSAAGHSGTGTAALLDKVVLDIVAESGAGQLLGSLLCAVAGLLDGGGTSRSCSTSSIRSWASC
jgi:hypothetical protein